MSQPVVFAKQVGKTYKVYPRPWDRIRELVTGRPCHQGIAALRDVSFELHEGESLGIIGENGAGKSTLLSMLSGVTSPSAGEIAVRGNVASLLELGMGFHPELSGRQNILLNAAMLGLSERQAQDKAPAIVEFSELGDFIDRPVKTYSTGMAMRLGFAIAVQVEPDVLIIDEALSVGDGYFQKKCMDRIRHFVDSGRTLLFCSHAMYYISHLCPRAVWLRQGRVAAYGPAEEVVQDYENFLLDKSKKNLPEPEEHSSEGKVASITSIRQLETAEGEHNYRYGDPWSLEICWQAKDPQLAFHIGVGLDRIDGVQICSFGTHGDELPPLRGRTSYRARLRVPELPILKGQLSLYVFLLDEAGLHVYDRQLVPAALTIELAEYRMGLIQVDHHWDLESSPPG
ncbi:MAG: ABC transporter ATP-binding protein [Acidobacteriota bacterium]